MNEGKTKLEIRKYLLIATYTVVLYLLLTNLGTVVDFLSNLIRLLNPVIIGIAIAYILNILLRLYENKVFAPLNRRKLPLWDKMRRVVSMLLTYLTMLVFIVLLAWFILPQLVASITKLTANIPSNLEYATQLVNNLLERFGLEGDIWNRIAINWNEIMQTIGQVVGESLPYLLDITKKFTGSFINVVMGLMLSVYLLFSKEKIARIFKKLTYAFLPRAKADKTLEISTLTNKAFSGFIAGQLTEALILGVLCFVGMNLFSMPYALLVSVIIGVTSIVPIFGAYIGTIPSAFIILMEDPIMAIWFVVFIIVLQQLEGNLIYPKVVGNSIGLSGVWVLFALMVGGSLFGLAGMLLGIPAFAVVYALLRSYTNYRLKQRKIDI